jgi:hypothetical protein
MDSPAQHSPDTKGPLETQAVRKLGLTQDELRGVLSKNAALFE